jgi:hypothetical protein
VLLVVPALLHQHLKKELQFGCTSFLKTTQWHLPDRMLELNFMEIDAIREKGLRVCSKHEAYNCPSMRHESEARLRWNAIPDKQLVMPRLELERHQSE